MLENVKQTIISMTNMHWPNKNPNVFIFSTPRSGSTWLMELIGTQPGFKPCNEPFNMLNPVVRKHLAHVGITEWVDFHRSTADAALHQYIQGFCTGQLDFKTPFFYRNYFRLITHRIVFKILHAGEERINWFRDTFNGRIVFLIRHPIPVGLSRVLYPKLEALLTTEYSQNFTPAQLKYAKKIVDSGTKLEQGVLDWCLQNAVPLKSATPDWVLLSYEQLVMDPQPVVERLADRLELPRREKMLLRLPTPSASTHKSDQETQQVLHTKDAGERNQWLIDKWCERVTEEEEYRAMKILENFDLDVYSVGSTLPADWLWIKPSNKPEHEGNTPKGAGCKKSMAVR